MPGHINLSGNDKADELAKQAIEEDKISRHKLTMDDGINLLRNSNLKKWQVEYDESLTKGKFQKQLVKKVSLKPWFAQTNLNQQEVKTLNRLRTNHGLSQDRKFTYGRERNMQPL